MARRLPDKEKLTPTDQFHLQLMHANELVREAMLDEDFVSILNEMRAEAIHDHGNSINKTMKHKHCIPQGAFMALPSEVQQDDSMLDEWVKYHHPYLIITNF